MLLIDCLATKTQVIMTSNVKSSNEVRETEDEEEKLSEEDE